MNVVLFRAMTRGMRARFRTKVSANAPAARASTRSTGKIDRVHGLLSMRQLFAFYRGQSRTMHEAGRPKTRYDRYNRAMLFLRYLLG